MENNPPESRCLICGCPLMDHQPIRWWLSSGIPLRYLIKAWAKHGVISLAGRILGRIKDTSVDW